MSKSLIKADIHQGIVSRLYIYLIPMLLGLSYTDMFIRQMSDVRTGTAEAYLLSFGDCIVNFFKGMREYVPSDHNPFDVPIQFLIVNLVLAIFIGNYPMKDIHGFGKLKLVRSRTRLDWWLGKCVWNICTVVMFYISMYIGMLIDCMMHASQINMGSVSGFFSASSKVVDRIIGLNGGKLESEVTFTLIMVVLPVITSIALSLLQMSVALMTIPVVSYIMLIAVYIFSAFYMRWFTPGNYLMAYRMKAVLPNGVDFMTAIAVDIVLMVIAVVAGNIYFRKYDIYSVQ